jgi:enamine deaminase RidA (YjgF/YER057c/UK114 family)
MSTVVRLQPGSRLGEAAVHHGTIRLAGQVDRLLAAAGSDKSMILIVQIFLADISEFDGKYGLGLNLRTARELGRVCPEREREGR